MESFPWLALIPAAPLIGAAMNGLLGARLQRRWGRPAVHVPAIALPTLSFLITVAAFLALRRLGPEERVLSCVLWDWMPVGTLQVSVALSMDPLSLLMAGVVTFVGTLIHIYSVGYMRGDPSYWRFFSHLNLFLFFMLVLVLADNPVLMFVGWEGVGLCSYLLIGFWYKKPENAKAGMKAFVVNRIGDFGFLLGILLLFWSLNPNPAHKAAHQSPSLAEPAHASVSEASGHEAGPVSMSFQSIKEHLSDPEVRAEFASRRVFGVNLVALLGVLFFLGAMGKSAQIPLHVWLPDAMAGPTPVSALIHAATMVTAGVYLVARLNFLYVLSPFAMTWVALIGALTCLFAATIGLFQHDIKKVLAYSTVSQLGYMFIAVGVGAYAAGTFHLMTHAFFKACLFLGSGSVILGCHHEQDMRYMGGLRKLMPVTAITYFLACCAIAGFPLTAGFFSKDEILWKAFDAGSLILPGGGLLIWFLGSLGAACTSFYMFRSYYMTFSGEYRGGHAPGHGDDSGHGGAPAIPHESPRSITSVLTLLAAFSLVVGWLGPPEVWGLPNALHHWLEPVFEESSHLVHEAGKGPAYEWLLMGFASALALSGWFFARWLYLDARNPLPARLAGSKDEWLQRVYRLVYNKYYVDELYERTVIRGVMQLRTVLDHFDKTVIDGSVHLVAGLNRAISRLMGQVDSRGVDGAVNGVAISTIAWGRGLQRLQTGNLRTYLSVVAIATMVLILANYLLFT